MRKKNRNSIENIKKLPQFTTMNVIDGQAGIIICSSLIFYSLTIDNILNIIVLLILAAVSIATLTGKNGLLTKASEAKEETRGASVEETKELWLAENIGAEYYAEATKRTLEDVLEELQDKRLLTEDEANEVRYTGSVTIGSRTIIFSEIQETPASDFETVELEDGTIAIVKYKGTSKNIVFPSKIDGKTVTAIGTKYDYRNSWNVVSYNFNLLSVYIPKTVKIIGDGAFDGSFSETSDAVIYIPDGVEYIGEYSFEFNGISKVYLPDSVLEIGEYAFFKNNLQEIRIPNKLQTLTLEVFARNQITEVIIPDSITYIDYYALCDNKISNLSIPSSVTYIGGGAFANNCMPEERAYIYNRNSDGTEDRTTLNSYAGMATNTVTPSNIKTIGDSAFEGCSNVEEVIISQGVEIIESNAFRNCEKLKSVKIPNTVTSMGSHIFASCSSLTDVEIPNSVTSISHSIFDGCTSLIKMTIPDSITSIPGSLFSGCTSLKEVTLPNNVTDWSSSIFDGCTSLTSITIPNGISQIGMYTFRNCTSLTNITIPDSVTTIDYGAFYGCTGCSSITIPDGVSKIGTKAFYNVPHIYYNGTATGSPWGAKAIN